MPPPPQLPSTTSSTVRRYETSGARAPGRAELGAASQALVGACQRRASSEVSLPPTVVGILGTEWIRRGGEGRVEHERASKGGGGGSGVLLEGNQEGIQRHDLEGGGGGGRGGVGSRGED